MIRHHVHDIWRTTRNDARKIWLLTKVHVRKTWPSIIFFVVLAAVAAVMLYMAIRLLAPNVGLLNTILLLTAAVFATIIIFYLGYRLSAKQLSSVNISDAVDTFGGLARTFWRQDKSGFDSSLDQTKRLVSRARPFVNVTLGFLLFNTLFLELLAIGNAVAIYLQSERLEEQNSLLDSQNRLMESQAIIAKHQLLSEVAGFLGESQTLLQDLSNSAAEMIEYEQIIGDIVERFPVFQDIPADECAEMAGCVRIDSMDNSVVANWALGESDGWRSLYLTSASIVRAYEKLAVLFSEENSDGIEDRYAGHGTHIRERLYQFIYGCGLLHHPELTTHDNRRLLDLSARIAAVYMYSGSIVDAWDLNDIHVDTRFDVTRSSSGLVDEILKELVGNSEQAPSSDKGTLFTHALFSFKDLMEDLRAQCGGKISSNYEIHNLLTEFTAKSYSYIFSLLRSGLSERQLPMLFEQSIVDGYRPTRDTVGDRSVVMPGGVRVGPWPAELESD